MTAPLWFKAPFKILRLFVREKLRDRVYTVSLPQVSLLYFHSSIYLPFSTQTSANYFYYPLFCVFVSGLEQQLVAVERVKLGCAHPIIYGVDFFPLFFSLFCVVVILYIQVLAPFGSGWSAGRLTRELGLVTGPSAHEYTANERAASVCSAVLNKRERKKNKRRWNSVGGRRCVLPIHLALRMSVLIRPPS